MKYQSSFIVMLGPTSDVIKVSYTRKVVEVNKANSIGIRWHASMGSYWWTRFGAPSISINMLQYSEGIYLSGYFVLLSKLLEKGLLKFQSKRTYTRSVIVYITYRIWMFRCLFCPIKWIQLPSYKRSSTLRAKLLYAIKSNAGFELS